jgi:hypothetical protein
MEINRQAIKPIDERNHRFQFLISGKIKKA